MDAEDLRLAVYHAFAETGRAPEPGELATKLGTEAREVAAGLAELARAGTWRSAARVRSSWRIRSRPCRSASR